MALQVASSAMMTCSFGQAPAGLVVLRPNNLSSGKPAANILDSAPMANIQPFGLCSSLSNPTVAAATAAALGVLTPMPCMPATSAPWVPGKPKVLCGGAPALDATSKLMCAWGGIIQITVPGQLKEMLP